jgi:ribosomal protein S18 acetylase RimI-like enzyme
MGPLDKILFIFLFIYNYNYIFSCNNIKNIFFLKMNGEILKIKIKLIELETEKESENFENKLLIEDQKFYYFREAFINKNIIAYIKKDNNYLLIGRLRFYFEDKENKVIYIEYLDIHKDYQKMGLGSLLIKELLENYSEKNFSLKSKKDAFCFYKKIGFVEGENEKFYLYLYNENIKKTLKLINENKNIKFDKEYKIKNLFCSFPFNYFYF